MAFRLIFAVGVAAAQSDDHVAFDEWKQTYARRYASEEEEAQRFEIFQANLRYYEARTANDTAVYGPDEMSDRTHAEWVAARTSPDLVNEFQALSKYCFDGVDSDEDVQSVLQEYGDSIDWQAKGAVTGVKNQGQFGTCWAFTATAIMEGLNVAQGGNPLESISEQELIDCFHPANVGRSLDQYYKDKHLHPANEETYPYRGSKGSCRRNSSTLTKAGVKKVLCPPNGPNNNQDNMLANLVKLGPGGFLIESSGLRGYRGGIISNHPSKVGPVDHGTTVVGAGEENGVPYFRVKNSWGASFGEHGYYRVKRNTNPPQLGCPGGIFGVYDGFGSVLV